MVSHIVLKIQESDTKELQNPGFCGRWGILMGARKGTLKAGEREVISNLKLTCQPAVGFLKCH